MYWVCCTCVSVWERQKGSNLCVCVCWEVINSSVKRVVKKVYKMSTYWLQIYRYTSINWTLVNECINNIYDYLELCGRNNPSHNPLHIFPGLHPHWSQWTSLWAPIELLYISFMNVGVMFTSKIMFSLFPWNLLCNKISYYRRFLKWCLIKYVFTRMVLSKLLRGSVPPRIFR